MRFPAGPDVDLDELAEAGGLEQPLVDAATEVIEGLTLSSWNPDEYPNPGELDCRTSARMAD